MLESYSHFAIKQVFGKIFRFIQECEIPKPAGLKLEYMVDDYSREKGNNIF